MTLACVGDLDNSSLEKDLLFAPGLNLILSHRDKEASARSAVLLGGGMIRTDNLHPLTERHSSQERHMDIA